MAQVVIQHVATIWTKKSRGGEAATKRNAVPESLTLPWYSADAPFVLHSARFGEGDFSQRSELRTSVDFDEWKLSRLEVRIQNDILKARYIRDPYNAAMPWPYPHKDAFELKQSQWGQLVYNGRYTAGYEAIWWYEKHVYNIGLFAEWDSDVFVRSRPDQAFRELAMLR